MTTLHRQKRKQKRKQKSREIMSLSNAEQELEAEYYRLGQELLKLKQQGRISKHKKFSKIHVKRLVLEIGLPKLKTLSYQEFEALCKQHKI